MVIRAATAADAEALAALQREIAAETPATAPLAPDEARTAEELRAALGTYLVLVAEADGHVVGQVSLRRPSPRRALAHIGVLGMSVTAAHRGRGLGKQLIAAALAAAAEGGMTRVELLVFADNARAIALYEKCGFAHEGRRRNAVRWPDGRYADDLMMAKLL